MALKGSVTHDFLNLVFKKKYSIDELGKYLFCLNLPSYTFNDILKNYDSIRKVYRAILKLIQDLKKKGKVSIISEYHIRTNLPDTSIQTSAIVDLIISTDTTYFIIDHKSNASDADAHYDQLYFYSLLLTLSSQQEKFVETYISDIKTGVLHKGFSSTPKAIKNELYEKFINELSTIIVLIEESNSFPPKRSQSCRWCHLKSDCKLQSKQGQGYE
jgi:CRISPR/Cas system-associated exonuclease Cas4 (RecB family)